jgi:glucose-6-phosphate isomerase
VLPWRAVLHGAAMAGGLRRTRAREVERIRVDVNGMMAHLLGEAGLDDADLDELAPRLADVAESLARRRRGGTLGFVRLLQGGPELAGALELAREVREELDDLVVLGIGGSALGTRALYAALAPPGHACGPPRPGELRVHVADTIDPGWFGALLGRLDLRRTLFNVISKSGDTAETMSQFLVVRDRLLKELGALEYARHVVITTDAEHGTLRQIVNDEGFRSLVLPANVGGRFSVLSCVGLFPAACAGIDVEALLAGARDMDERCRRRDPRESPALLHAALLHLAARRGSGRIVVMMPYAQGLAPLADWFRQLWAESLGKALDLTGARVHAGQTPLGAVGPADQHTQLQLLVEGPADKVVVFLRVEEHGAEIEIPRAYDDLESVGYLGGHRLGALLNMEQQGTELALAKAGRMTSTIVCPRVSPFVVGQLLHLLETEAVVTAGLLGVDPFDQPGIEEGKALTWGLAGRPGFEGKRADVQRWAARKDAHYVV